MRTTVLGLDLGAICGFTLFSVVKDRGMMSATGRWRVSQPNDIDGQSALGRFEQDLTSVIGCGVQKVFYQDVRRKGADTTEVYGALRAKMMQICNRHAVPSEALKIAEVKRFATGNGNASKSSLIEAVRRWGFTVADDANEEASAVFLAMCGWETRT